MCKDCGCSLQGWHHHGDGNWHQHNSDIHEHKHLHEHDLKHEHEHERMQRQINEQTVTHVHSDKSALQHYLHEKNVLPIHAEENLKIERVKMDVQHNILLRNVEVAQRNRFWFLENGILCLNFISSPGSGKTMFLEKLLPLLTMKYDVAVLVGDQATSLDSHRLMNKGARVKQINTPSSCHLDASHIEKELISFVTKQCDILIIENVGNLVCPAAFDLGEACKVALLSCTEGEEKPIKYPLLFSQALAIVLTKVDLAPYLDWSIELTLSNIRKVNALAPIFKSSAKNETGLDSFIEWIDQKAIEVSKNFQISQ